MWSPTVLHVTRSLCTSGLVLPIGLCPCPGPKGPSPSRGERAMVCHGLPWPLQFSHFGPVLSPSAWILLCSSLSSALSEASFFFELARFIICCNPDTHVAVCSLPRTLPCDSPFGPRPHPGRDEGLCAAECEISRQLARGCSGAPGLGPSPPLTPPPALLLLWSSVQVPWGP